MVLLLLWPRFRPVADDDGRGARGREGAEEGRRRAVVAAEDEVRGAVGHAGRRRGDRALGREGFGRSRDLGHVPGDGLRADDAEALVVAERGEHGGGVDGRRRAARRGPVRDDGGRAARARDELEARRVEGVELRAAAEDRVERRRRRAACVEIKSSTRLQCERNRTV